MVRSKSSRGLVQRCEAAACLFMLQSELCEETPAIWNINRSFSIPFTRRTEISHSEKAKMQCKLAPHKCLHANTSYRSIKYWICINTKSSYAICLYFCLQTMPSCACYESLSRGFAASWIDRCCISQYTLTYKKVLRYWNWINQCNLRESHSHFLCLCPCL